MAYPSRSAMTALVTANFLVALGYGALLSAAVALYDERFCRMWEFYLAGSEMAFRNGDLTVFQLQLSPSREALPIVRDYMVDDERRLLARNRRKRHLEAA